jgi:hypothetical protein
MAFYHPHADGEIAARAYLLTFGQLSDVVAQEIRRPVGTDISLDGAADRRWLMNSRTYETLLRLPDRDGLPMFTITSLRKTVATTPSASYLHVMLDGLGEAFGWSAHARAQYLLRASGVAPAWNADRLVELCH